MRQRIHRASERAEPRRKHPDRERWDAMVARGVPKREHKTRITDGPNGLGYGWECATCRSFAGPFESLEAAYAAADDHAKE